MGNGCVNSQESGVFMLIWAVMAQKAASSFTSWFTFHPGTWIFYNPTDINTQLLMACIYISTVGARGVLWLFVLRFVLQAQEETPQAAR